MTSGSDRPREASHRIGSQSDCAPMVMALVAVVHAMECLVRGLDPRDRLVLDGSPVLTLVTPPGTGTVFVAREKREPSWRPWSDWIVWDTREMCVS